MLQRTGFLNAPGPCGTCQRLPHGLVVEEEQRLKATAASHALLAAGHNVHIDRALRNTWSRILCAHEALPSSGPRRDPCVTPRA